MPKMILFQDDDVTIGADLRDTEKVVICFSNFGELDRLKSFGEGFVQSIGHSAIFLSAKHDHWWQVPQRERMCDLIRAATCHYRDRTAYGASMGGYGALSFGAACGCTRILAIAPQTVISDAAVPLGPKWADAIARRPILRDSVAEDLAGLVPDIVYDPHVTVDRLHVRYLRTRTPIREQRFPFAGHKLLGTLHECGQLRQVATALLDAGEFRQTLTSYLNSRHRSPSFLFNMALHELRQGDATAARATAALIRGLGDVPLHKRLCTVIDREAGGSALPDGRPEPA